jgi:pimeloyl-ACP methyl ester carboxylesterase
MSRIYCITGLAADHSLFLKLDIPGYELIPMPWQPFDKADNMRTYASKMAQTITAEQPIIIGLSFGGMLSVELAKQHPDWKIILVSSAKTSTELGYNNAFFRWLANKDIVPASLFNRPNSLTLFNLGANTGEEKAMMSQLIRNSDAVFMKWCVRTLLHWNNVTYPANITHIHGTKDRVIRSANVHPDHWVEGGSHIMIYNRAAEVSKIISDCLAH